MTTTTTGSAHVQRGWLCALRRLLCVDASNGKHTCTTSPLGQRRHMNHPFCWGMVQTGTTVSCDPEDDFPPGSGRFFVTASVEQQAVARNTFKIMPVSAFFLRVLAGS